jgi:type I restriction enzyme S subunit
MEVKPGYKQTEVGVIPEEWEALPAREVGIFRGGSGFPLEAQGETSGDYPFFKVSDMNNEGNETFMTTANHWISEHTRKRLGANAFPVNAIVFAKVGAAIFLERKKILGQPSCIDNNMAALVLDKSRADVRFVHTLLLSKKLGSLVATTALPALNGKQLGEMALTLPPLPEQRAIATALSDVDGLLGGLDRLIAKKRDLKQAAMQQLLTGQTRLPGFHGEREVKRLGELFNFSGGYSASRDQLSTEGHCYLHYGDIHGSNKTCIDTDADFQNIPKLDIPLKRVSPASLLDDGDVVFVDASEDDAGTSKHVVVVNKSKKPFISGLHTIVAKSKTNELAHEYRRYCFQTPAIRQQFLFYSVGTKVSGISKSNIPKLTLSFPSVPEQTAIASVLSEMDGELAVLEQRREKTRALKQAMMQSLLTGQIRLPPQTSK